MYKEETGGLVIRHRKTKTVQKESTKRKTKRKTKRRKKTKKKTANNL